jgi:hypothetical protein
MPIATAPTALEIIQDAHLFAGIGDLYNPPDGTQAAAALRFLNALQDSFTTEEKTIFGVTVGTFNMPVAPANNLVQVGPGQALGLRPVNVERVNLVDAQGVSHRVRIIGVDEWARIIYLPAPGRPEVVYIDGNVPVSGWYFWPNESFTGDVCNVWYWSELQQFLTLSDVLVAPQGTTWFLKTALGMALMSMLKMQPTPLQAEMYEGARRNMRALNNQPKQLVIDIPMSDGRGRYNIYTDQIQ